ncbi:MAG: hypothetical protein ACRDSR_24135 [Pseudonocardiaceae bacterium]
MNRYVVNNAAPQQGISLTGFTHLAQTRGGGPLPAMARGGTSTEVAPRQYKVIDLDGPNHGRLFAPGLITCAAMIIASTARNAPPRAAVYHAPSGTIASGVLESIRSALGKPRAASLLVAWVIARPWDQGDDSAVQKIVDYGVPADQVTGLESSRASHFGIDSEGGIGI